MLAVALEGARRVDAAGILAGADAQAWFRAFINVCPRTFQGKRVRA